MDNSYLIFSLIGAAVLAFIPASIARSKGRSFGAWYVYGFLLWIVAVIHAAALPYPQNTLSQTQPQQAPMRDVSQISPNQIVNAPRKMTLSQDMNTDYDVNMPMDVLWYAIQKNEMSNIIYLEIKLISFFTSPIKALKLDIHCFDAFGDPVGKSNIYHALLQDLNIIPHTETFLNFIELNGFENTRSVKIDVTQALLQDEIWNNTESRSAPTGQKWTGQDLEYSKFLYGENAVYKPEETEYGWNCTCGRPNSNLKVQCIRCQTKREDALKITSSLLKQLAVEKKVRIQAENEQSRIREEQSRIREEQSRFETERRRQIETERQRQISKAKREQQIQTAKIIISIFVVVVTIIILLLILVNLVIIPNSKYNKAQDMLNSKQYDEAITIFAELGEYRDSADQLDLAKYNKAQGMLTNKQYDNAIVLFSELGEYRDSADQIDSAKYSKAQEMLANKQYDNAIALFTELGNYRDSADQNLEKYKIPMIKSAKVGDIVYWGKYEQDNNTANGKEDIAWRVLLIENGKLLLIADKNLDSQRYNTDLDFVTWENCSLREWLNATFYEEAFTPEEQAMIPTTLVINYDNLEYLTGGGNSTNDKVFLLCTEEANSYFANANDGASAAFSTPYAVAQGAIVGGAGGSEHQVYCTMMMI